MVTAENGETRSSMDDIETEYEKRKAFECDASLQYPPFTISIPMCITLRPFTLSTVASTSTTVSSSNIGL